MNKYILIVLCLISGCGPMPEEKVHDQCIRREVFKECMAALPAGPISTQYNDWGEVVDSCNSVSAQQSVRSVSVIKPGCK